MCVIPEMKWNLIETRRENVNANKTSQTETAHPHLDLAVRKPVFGVSVKASFKPVSSATETSQKIEISTVASLHMVLL